MFDLVANRSLAHAERNGALSIAAGSPGFARYVHFSRPLPTWKLRQTEDGKRVALAQTQAVLEVPLTAAEARGNTVTLRLKSPVKQTVRATVAGKASAAMPVSEGWQTVTIAVPPGALVEGENKITLGFANSGKFGDKKAAAAVEWIDIGAPSNAQDAPSVGNDTSLTIPAKGALSYFVQIPQGGALQAKTSGCAVHVTASGDHGGGKVDAQLGDGKPLDLSALADHVVRLQLSADNQACTLGDAALLTAGDAVTVKKAPAPRNVVFWLTDDTRSDKFKLFNPKTRVETPVIDEFAKRATTFKVAYVQGNESRVSHASLWTSLYPLNHQFIAEKAKLNPKFVTLPEAVKPTGRFTAGLMGNGFIDAYWGFAEGWDFTKNCIHETCPGLTAGAFVTLAKEFLGKHEDKPYFLYLGTIDAHVSWRAHQPWLAKYDPEPYNGPFVKVCSDPQLDKIVAGKMGVTERDKTRVIALYDSDVSYNDQQFGELLKLIKADDTMIIFTADHGEELWDHGKIGHGQSVREELVHVPLLISYPPLFPAGKSVTEGVEIIDLMPTIVDALGGKIPADAQGESLIALAQGGDGAGYPRPAIGSQYELAHTMRLGKWKLWVGGSGETRLFDASTDAAETHELTAERPVERRFVEDALGMWMAYQAQWKKSRWGVASNQKPELTKDLEKPQP